MKVIALPKYIQDAMSISLASEPHTARLALPSIAAALDPECPQVLLDLGERHHVLELRINEAYENGEDPADLEEQAAVLASTIENAMTALTEEGEDYYDPPVTILDEAFARAYFDIDRAEVAEFLARGGPKRVPPRSAIRYSRHGAQEPTMLPEYDEYPMLVRQLQSVIEDAHGRDLPPLPPPDPVALIEAAREVYEAREALKKRVRAHSRRIASSDPVEQARRFLERVKR